MTDTPPGYYPAQGDPAGTVRYWDGTQWSTEPMPAPPGYDPSHRPGDERYATIGIRIGAALLDVLVGLVLLLPVLISFFQDVLDDIDAGGDGSSVEVPGTFIAYGLALGVIWFLMVALFGGTPGKLLLGLRITLADAATTPPGFGPAALRALPSVAGVIPVLGQFVPMVFALASVFMVATDSERRSLYDRIAGTRVVRRKYL